MGPPLPSDPCAGAVPLAASGTAPAQGSEGAIPPVQGSQGAVPPAQGSQPIEMAPQEESGGAQNTIHNADPGKGSSASKKNSGVPTRNSGAPARNIGAPTRNSGTPARNSGGAPTRNSGAPARNSDVPTGNGGVDQKDSKKSRQGSNRVSLAGMFSGIPSNSVDQIRSSNSRSRMSFAVKLSNYIGGNGTFSFELRRSKLVPKSLSVLEESLFLPTGWRLKLYQMMDWGRYFYPCFERGELRSVLYQPA